MAFTKKFFFLFLVLATAFASCKKDDTTPNGSMTAVIDGDNWQGKASAVMQAGLTNISGVADDGSVLTLTLMGQAEGEYLLGEGGDHAGVFTKGTAAETFASNQGNDAQAFVNITSINEENSTLSGEFQFTAFNLLTGTQRVVASGKFSNVTFTGNVTSSGEDFLECKIDGEVFKAGLVSGGVTPAPSILLLIGSSSDGTQSIGLNLSPDVTVGEHKIGGAFSENWAQYNPDSATFLASESGKVKITKHDKANKKIEGTFRFEAEEIMGGGASASIKEGKFSVKYL